MSTTDLSIDKIKSLIFHINGINFLIEKLDRQRRRKKYESLREIFSRWLTMRRAKYALRTRMKNLEEMIRLMPKNIWVGRVELLLRAGNATHKAGRFSFGMECYQIVLDITSSDKLEDHETRLLAYTGNIECGIEKIINDMSHYSKIDDFGYKHLSFQHAFVWEALDSVSPAVREDLKPRLIRSKNLMYLFETKREALILAMPRTAEYPSL